MTCIIIFGPQAVGKMTVGYELEKITHIPLFHNHMTIDLVQPFFGYNTEIGKKLVHEFRFRIFEEVAKTKDKSLIFTYVWALDQKSDHAYIEKIIKIFAEHGRDIFFVELETNLETRLKRNIDEFRLEKKPGKRKIEHSEKQLLEDTEKYRLNSFPGEIKYKNYIRINNTNLTAQKTAEKIRDYFGL